MKNILLGSFLLSLSFCTYSMDQNIVLQGKSPDKWIGHKRMQELYHAHQAAIAQKQHQGAGVVLAKHFLSQGCVPVNKHTGQIYPRQLHLTATAGMIHQYGVFVDTNSKLISSNDNPQKKPFEENAPKKIVINLRRPNKTLTSTHKNHARTRQLDKQ